MIQTFKPPIKSASSPRKQCAECSDKYSGKGRKKGLKWNTRNTTGRTALGRHIHAHGGEGMTTPNEELISMLRAKGCPDWVTARWLMESAADLLQSQAERIKELGGGVTHWKALREAAVNVANDRREERDTLAADNARLRTLVIGLQTDAERYRHAKLYDLLDGWDDESIDRDIRIHNLVVNAAIKGGV